METGKRAFVLPFVIILSGALMVFVTLLLDQVDFNLRQAMLKSIDHRARLSLKLNMDPLIFMLEEALSAKTVATYTQQHNWSGKPVQGTCLLGPTNAPVQLLYSHSQEQDLKRVIFKSSSGNQPLMSGKVPMDSDNEQPGLSIAWTFEDLSLASLRQASPVWWPLPQMQMNLSRDPNTSELEAVTGSPSMTVPRIDPTWPLAFSPEGQPAFVPVIRRARLKFGIFASGNSGQREKILRIRYYVECSIWNPYNRRMEFHTGSQATPAFQVAFYHLPMLRILNLSNGMATGWIDMNSVRNSQSGAMGIHAWIRTKGSLQPGETADLLEPDPALQPEGLARILHPSFMVSPGDSIQIEFKQGDQGISVACLTLEEPDPVSAAARGDGWSRYRTDQYTFPDIEFPRADDPDKLFYLESGSLSFRQRHAQAVFSTERKLPKYLDPRLADISADAHYSDAAGFHVRGMDIMETSIVTGKAVDSTIQEVPAIWPALVSWPADDVTQLMQMADLPGWQNAFCIGSSNAVAINSILDSYWPYTPRSVTMVETHTGRSLRYTDSIHINTHMAESWLDLLNGKGSGDGLIAAAQLALYPNPVGESDYLELNPVSLKGVAGRLAGSATSNPSNSVSNFFNSGRMSALMLSETSDSLTELLPLRGLKDRGYQLDKNGSAFVLHTACFYRYRGIEKVRTARIWLLNVPDEKSRINLQLVNFEWTDPGDHLVGFN